MRAATELDDRRNEGFPVVLRGTPHCQESVAERAPLLFRPRSVERVGVIVWDRAESAWHPPCL